MQWQRRAHDISRRRRNNTLFLGAVLAIGGGCLNFPAPYEEPNYVDRARDVAIEDFLEARDAGPRADVADGSDVVELGEDVVEEVGADGGDAD